MFLARDHLEIESLGSVYQVIPSHLVAGTSKPFRAHFPVSGPAYQSRLQSLLGQGKEQSSRNPDGTALATVHAIGFAATLHAASIQDTD
jgi:hypothetical protein